MVAWMTAGLALIVIFLIVLKASGKTGRLLGQSDERRRAAEDELARIDRALEELAAPPPDRQSLARRWMRRIQGSRKNDNDSTVSDSDNGNGN